MPRYAFGLDQPRPRVVEDFPDDEAAKRYACIIADEINRNARRQSPVLLWGGDGALLAVARPMED